MNRLLLSIAELAHMIAGGCIHIAKRCLESVAKREAERGEKARQRARQKDWAVNPPVQ